jgi:hypothetical protein
MTQIIGGQKFEAVRDGQLEKNKTRILTPALKDMAAVTRSRLACYYSQYDLVPIKIKDRVIAYVPGKYLAKIIRSSGACRFIAGIDGYIRRGLWKGKSKTCPVGIFHSQLLVLEASQMLKEEK